MTTTTSDRKSRLSSLQRLIPFLGYLAVQSFIVAGLVTPRFPDSPYYAQLSFTGQDLRLWTVPLLYNIFDSDPLRIAAQVLLASYCWWFLATCASRTVKDHRVALGLRIVLLILGVVGPIANWNSTILSDSTAISLTAALVGCWINHIRKPSWKTALTLVVVTLLWSCTRNDLVYVAALITFITLVVVLVRARNLINVLLAGGLIVISAYGLAIDRQNPFVANANIADVIEQRVLYNTDWTNWFVAHGMPYSQQIQSTRGGTYGLALMAIPSFNDWLTNDGTKTYTEFMLTHPVYTLYDPLPDFSGEKASLNWLNTSAYSSIQTNPTPSMFSPTAIYGRHREVLPSTIEDLFFEQGQIGDVLLLAFIAFGMAWTARRRLGPDRRMWLPIMVTLSAIPQGYLVWLLGGNAEVDRHAIITAVSLRIGLWITAAYALDRLIATRPLRKRASHYS